MLGLSKLEEKLKKDQGPSNIVIRVLNLRLVPGRPVRNSRCGRCNLFHPQSSACRGTKGVRDVREVKVARKVRDDAP